MQHLRMAAVAAVVACGLMLAGGAGIASAQTASPTPAFAKQIPITGTKGFKGTYTIQRFVQRNGKAFAVGTLKGKLHGKTVTKRNVSLPATLKPAAQGAQVPTPGACQVLNLVLGPINLKLLGLRVATNEIHLLIEAIPGAGNLLGNLLCAITNLLNPSANSPLAQLVQVLNALLALAPATPTG
jgi:hypothetical protein